MRASTCWMAFALVFLNACGESPPPPAQVRPVRTVVVEKRVVGEPVALTGHIRAQDEVSLAFRIDGKMTERTVNIGDSVIAGQLVGRLDPQNELNALRSARADLAAAQAALTQAQGTEGRQRELLQKGITTRAQYDQTLQLLQTAQSQVESAQARLHTAEDRRNYTELHAEAPGAVIAKGAEPGEVIRAGQMIVQVAREGGKDAIFDVPAQLMRAGRPAEVEIYLADNPSIRTTGRVREVSPQADPATRTHQVKVGLIDPPQAMFLGATVVGSASLHAETVIELPGTALMQSNGKPAVWVVDKANETVNLRQIGVARYGASSVIVAQGLQDGEIVVTAGVHALRPGQKVKVTDVAP
jgi:membrane fusion protein, multidrug efflux system